MAIIARMTMIEMTIISSSSVKPFDCGLRIADCGSPFVETCISSSGSCVARRRLKRRAPVIESAIRNPNSAIYLPVTVLLPVERRAVGLRAHVEDVGGACRAALVRRVVVREHAPVGLARYRVDGNLAEVMLLLRRGRGVVGRLPAHAVESAPGLRQRAAERRARHDVNPVNQSLEVGREAVGGVNAEDRAVGDDDGAARVIEGLALLAGNVRGHRRGGLT